MPTADRADHGFVRLGPAEPACPVILAVPHAGRDYPAELLAAARLPRATLERLEDRHADLLVAEAVLGGATAFVATRARAWIDLNRGEREFDPAMVASPTPVAVPSVRVRNGLGLLPRRIPGSGDILSRTISAASLAERIEHDHRPWHSAIADALAAAKARFGAALLLDLHSMPPIVNMSGPAPRVVIGDRFGHSASPHLSDRLMRLAAAHHPSARNAPYAGGHTLDRHGRPHEDVHAIQIELDRALYLDLALDEPGPGLAACCAFVAELVATAVVILTPRAEALAAE